MKPNHSISGASISVRLVIVITAIGRIVAVPDAATLPPLRAASVGALSGGRFAGDEILPKHITAPTMDAVRRGLDFLARTQNNNGGWIESRGGEAYPVTMTSLAGLAMLANGNTPTRGRYAPQVAATLDYLLRCTTPNGLITGAGEESGRPMYGHGFALLFLASTYGMETKESTRAQMRDVIQRAVDLTARGQSPAGGWTYTPGSGDEGSVTVTQIQALRAAHNAGFLVPRGTIEESVRYIERCSTPEGGICYSLGSGGGARLAISAAACATLYNAGAYDAPVAERCLDWVSQRFRIAKGFNKGGGHDYYTHLYAAQAFYLAGDAQWDAYFPDARDQILALQNKSEGSWDGDGIGKTYGTAIALIVLQLPYKYLPVFQR